MSSHAANDIMQTVYGVCTMSERQLLAVHHLLTPQIILAIPIASKLPRSNQARARQENFIAKLIRTSLTEAKQEILLVSVFVHRCRTVPEYPTPNKLGSACNDQCLCEIIFQHWIFDSFKSTSLLNDPNSVLNHWEVILGKVN